MFCKNCGKEINDDAKYCNFCGIDLINESSVSKNIKDVFRKAIDFFAPLGEIKKWLISVMILLFLNPILALLQNFKYAENITGKSIYSHTESVFDFLLSCAEELVFVNVLIVIGILSIIFAEFSMILPLIKNTVYKPKNILATKIIAIIAFLFFAFLNLVFFIGGSNDDTVKVSLTFWGWLLNFDTIALIVTTFKFSSIIKMENKKELE